MDGDAAHVAATQLDLAGGADRRAYVFRGGAEGERQSHGASRAVEGSEQSVGRFDEFAAVPVDHLLAETVVLVQASGHPLAASVAHNGKIGFCGLFLLES